MRRLKIWNLAALLGAGLGLWLGSSWGRPTELSKDPSPSTAVEKIARPMPHQLTPQPENGSPSPKKRV